MNDLLNHINQLNAQTQAWIDEAPNRWACMISNDVKMWNEQGIFTPHQLDHYFLVADLFETTRSMFGYKPHWGNLNAMTNEQLEAELKSLYALAKRDQDQAIEDERIHNERTAQALNHQSGFSIASLLAWQDRGG